MQRTMLSPIVYGLLLCLASVRGGEGEEELSRDKRFINLDRLNLDSFPRLGEVARDLGDQIVAQASMAVQRMMPHHRSAGPKNKRRGQIETEGEGSEDVEVFEPPRRPARPEVTWFRPLVPFSFSFGLVTPWWEGPDVCVERSEVEEGEEEESDAFSINFETTRCIPSDSSYVCTKKIQNNGVRKTIVVRRECCHGYVRRTDGRPGCAALKMVNLVETLKVLEMSKFVRWLESGDLARKLASTEANYTLFVPNNEAIADYEDQTEDNEISALMVDPSSALRPSTSSLVSGHVIEGQLLRADQLRNEQMLKTLDPEGHRIRINRYSRETGQQVLTANCVPFVGKDNLATNGVVHLVSGVLPRPTQSLAESIAQDERLSTFAKLLEESGLLGEMREKGGEESGWTIFAPTDDAFRRLPVAMRSQLESGDSCLHNILRHHVVRGTVCTSSVTDQSKVNNLLGNPLHLTRDEGERLRVGGAVVAKENLVATDGVLHLTDKVLVPPQAQSLLKVLEEEEREDILGWVEVAELAHEMEGMRNVTFFLPSKEALQGVVPNATFSDRDLMRSLVLNHLVDSHLPTGSFPDVGTHGHLETMAGHRMHLKLQEMFPGIVTGATVQCAHITSHDHQVCGAVIHKINKVLMPPRGSILQTLRGVGEDHSIFLKMLEANEPLARRLEEEEGPYTLLAPSDSAFERLGDAHLKLMLENGTRAEEVLKMHILPETVCCNSVSRISPFHRQFVRTLDGSLVPLHRSFYEGVKFGRARVTRCDTQATNGIVHSVHRVIMPVTATTLFGGELWPF